MALISRVVASGYPHHVTQRGVRSIPIFQTDSDRKAYLDFMGRRAEPLRGRRSRVVFDGLIEDWAEYLKGMMSQESRRRCFEGFERPAGGKQFVEMIERLTGRELVNAESGAST